MKTCLLFYATFIFVSPIFSASAEKQIKLVLQDSTSGQSSQAFIYFGQGLSRAYVQPQDEEMIFDTVMQVPDIYSFSSDGVPCYNNGYGDFTQSTTLQLGIRVQGGSTYTFYATGIDNFDPASIVLLQDRMLGTYTDLRLRSYSVNIPTAGRIDNRFYLIISYPPRIAITESNCNNTAGVISIAEDNSITWTSCNLYNSQGSLVNQYANITGNFEFQGLPEDSYNIQFTYGGYGFIKNHFLQGNEISVNISTSSTNAAVGENINFFSNAINVTDYEWQMGDSTIITGVSNPTYAYSASGTYNVQLKCTNPYGCQSVGSLTMNILDLPTAVNSLNNENVKIFSYNMDITIQIDNAIPDLYDYQLYDLSGKMLGTGAVNSSTFVLHQGNLPSGYYILKLQDRTTNQSMSKKLNLMQQ